MPIEQRQKGHGEAKRKMAERLDANNFILSLVASGRLNF